MGEHVAVPSQVANPWQAVKRTFFEVLIPGILLVLAVGPLALQILAEELDQALPEGVILWLLGAAGLLASLSAAAARIAAIPRINEALGRVKLHAGSPKVERVAGQANPPVE